MIKLITIKQPSNRPTIPHNPRGDSLNDVGVVPTPPLNVEAVDTPALSLKSCFALAVSLQAVLPHGDVGGAWGRRGSTADARCF